MNERLSKVISHLFSGKLRVFPLYKINLKVDRKPVKIPWILGEPGKEYLGSNKNVTSYNYRILRKVNSTTEAKQK